MKPKCPSLSRLESIIEAQDRLWAAYMSAPPAKRLEALQAFRRCERIKRTAFDDFSIDGETT